MQRITHLNTHFIDQATAHAEFNQVQQAPPDPILSIGIAYKGDTDPRKVNLSVGAYRSDEGKPYIFPVVRKAEQMIVADPTLDKEYAPIEGLADFNKGARGVVFGFDHPLVNDPRVVTAQTLSGTGALTIIANFLAKFRPAAIYVSNPTWGNHHQVFGTAGLQVRQYRYYQKETRGFDLAGMLEDLSNATPGSIVLLHTCAHNPTGVDPTLDQWKQIAQVCKSNKLFPFFDTAYQGFVSGNLDKDGLGLRYFIDQGFELAVSQSFAKTMGLYGERTGALHLVCANEAIAKKVLSQVKIVIRCNYSSPPKHGARIAAMILNDKGMREQWLGELVNVTDRISSMRQLLRQNLESNGCPGTWNHVTDQIGMFTFTGLTPAQSEAMITKHHVYMTKNGRISIAGLTKANVAYVAGAIKDVVQNN